LFNRNRTTFVATKRPRSSAANTPEMRLWRPQNPVAYGAQIT